jgi:hypothetical protein
VNDLVQKLNGRFLLELEAITNGIAGIHQQTHSQWQVSLTAEGSYRLRWFVVVNHAEIVFLQVIDELAALVGDGEDYIDFIDLFDDGSELLF